MARKSQNQGLDACHICFRIRKFDSKGVDYGKGDRYKSASVWKIGNSDRWDTSGALVPGVSITIKHTESGLTRSVVSSERGAYSVPLLPVGAYEISTTMPGFKQQVRSGVNLVVGQEAVVDLTLEVGGATEQVTVTEEAPLVNTTTSSTSGVITEQQVKELPLNGRSFDQLITLNVGVSNATSNTLDSGNWNMFSVSGKRPETFSRTPTAPSMENGPEVRSTS